MVIYQHMVKHNSVCHMGRGLENALAVTSSWCNLQTWQRKIAVQLCPCQPWHRKQWTSSVSGMTHPASWGDNGMNSGEAEESCLLRCLALPSLSKPSSQLFLYLLAPDDSCLWNVGLRSLLQGGNGCRSLCKELSGCRGLLQPHPYQPFPGASNYASFSFIAIGWVFVLPCPCLDVEA